MITFTSIVNEGFDAFYKGIKPIDCPYMSRPSYVAESREQMINRSMWLHGWSQAYEIEFGKFIAEGKEGKHTTKDKSATSPNDETSQAICGTNMSPSEKAFETWFEKRYSKDKWCKYMKYDPKDEENRITLKELVRPAWEAGVEYGNTYSEYVDNKGHIFVCKNDGEKYGY